MKNIFALLLLLSLSHTATSQQLIKFVIKDNRYIITTPDRIMAYDIRPKKEQMLISIDNHGASIWRVEIDNLPEKSALKLIKSIYSKKREEMLVINVNDSN